MGKSKLSFVWVLEEVVWHKTRCNVFVFSLLSVSFDLDIESLESPVVAVVIWKQASEKKPFALLHLSGNGKFLQSGFWSISFCSPGFLVMLSLAENKKNSWICERPLELKAATCSDNWHALAVLRHAHILCAEFFPFWSHNLNLKIFNVFSTPVCSIRP